MSHSQIPDPEPVLDLIEAFRRSKTMFTAVRLRLFERLQGGGATAEELATEFGVMEHALNRLLDGCVGLGLLAVDGNRYTNTPLARAYLTRSSPTTLTGYIEYSDLVLYPMWAHLEDSIREGTHRWKQTFGFSGSIFDSFFSTPEAKHDFLMGMHGMGMISSPAVVRAFDLSGYSELVDLGGASGHLAIAACQAYPGLRATVLDLPAAVAFAREIIDASPLRDRIQLLAADFFRLPLPAASIYAAGRILHDWDEPRIAVLLDKIYQSLPAGGALLIAEKLLEDDHSGPVSAHMQSLNMLVCTEGRERSLAEYTALLKAAGFREVYGRRTGTPLDAVLALK
jgi:acetylserotonin O-methyltransferase